MTKDISKLPLKKVKIGVSQPSYKVKWALYHDPVTVFENQELSFPKAINDGTEIHDSVCYSSVIHHYKSLSKEKNIPNRIYTELDLNPDPTNKNLPYLLRKEMREWLEICIANFTLPKNINPIKSVPSTKKGIMVLDLETADSTFTYLYLAMFRHIRESPSLVKSVLFLHKEHKLDFYIAYVLASSFNVTGEGHHPIKVNNSPYCHNKPIPKQMSDNINLKAACSLYRAVNEEGLVDVVPLSDATNWLCGNKISELCKKDFIVPISDLLDEELIKVVHSSNDEEAIKHFELYNNKMSTSNSDYSPSKPKL